MKVTLYTDGSSRGNPGPGGYGSIIITDTEVVELGGREDLTTNNRMELRGAIEGLRHIGDLEGVKEVLVKTDSEYVKKGMSEWIEGWIARGWKTAAKKPVLNQDLWQALKKEVDRLEDDAVHVRFEYVKAHAGIPLNERADAIATMCADDGEVNLYRGEKENYPHVS